MIIVVTRAEKAPRMYAFAGFSKADVMNLPKNPFPENNFFIV